MSTAFTDASSFGADGAATTNSVVVDGYTLQLDVTAGSNVIGTDNNVWKSGGLNVVWVEITPGSVYEGQTTSGTSVFRLSLIHI